MENREKKPLVPLCGLWKMPSGKGYSGKMGSARVVVFVNDRKRNEKEPDLRVYVQEDDWQKRQAHSVREPGSDDVHGNDDIGF